MADRAVRSAQDGESSLFALSPLDGRYATQCAPLRAYFSEAALIQRRIWVEVRYLDALTTFLDRDPLTHGERQRLFAWSQELGEADLQRVKAIEAETRHDVKAVEYFIRENLASLAVSRCSPWIHWGLTSEDVDNLAYSLALQEAKDQILVPAHLSLVRVLLGLARRYARTVMLARTHGQIAVPTTVGKEFVVFASRAAYFLEKMVPHRFGGKLNGAVGNWNAHYQLFPGRDWPTFGENLVRRLGLEPTAVTTQIEPATRLVYFLDLLRQLNNIWLDLARDCWLYISLGYFQQKVTEKAVGSSTMPHKVNPIDFENGEGNLQVANSLLVLLSEKLPISRLQRDLSDKTVKRNLGVALGYGLLAVQSIQRGLEKIAPCEDVLQQEVAAHPEVLAEAVQLLLKTLGEEKAFQMVQSQVRGEVGGWARTVAGLAEEPRRIVQGWWPEQYTGLAAQITQQEIARIAGVLHMAVEGESSPCPT